VPSAFLGTGKDNLLHEKFVKVAKGREIIKHVRRVI
jgi:hypothetical protein